MLAFFLFFYVINCVWICRIVVVKGRFGSYIELPAFDMFAGVFVGDDDDELGDFAANHPFVELAHDFLDVSFDLVIGGD